MTDQVTEIIKRTGCRVIYLMSGDVMTLPLMLFKLSPLRVGQELDPVAYRQGLAPKEAGLALEQAGRMLMTRDRTEAEIRKRLLEVGYGQEAVEQTLTRLTQARLVDDARYLKNYINMKIKKVGAGRIRRELMLKGIPAEEIAMALAETGTDAQLETAVKHAKKALAKKGDDQRHIERLAFAALARRGFAPDIAKKALAQARLSLLEQEEADGFPG